MLRDFRKPLIVFTSKKLLRYKLSSSNIKEFTEFSDNPNLFKNVIPETQKISDDNKVKKVVVCSGQIYWDLFTHREEIKRNVNYFKILCLIIFYFQDVAIVRIE